MKDSRLVIGFATAGRPTTYQECLNGLENNIDVPFDIVVVDNTPELNANVDTSAVSKIIEPSEIISPGESRQQIIESTDSGLLLFIDDDTIPHKKAVERLMNTLETNSVKMTSGIFWKKERYEESRNIGRILQTVQGNNRESLLDISIPLKEIIQSDITTWDVDVGTPVVMMQREVFDIASFDPRYDFFFEWIDFFKQTWKNGEKVRARADAKFEHLDGEYTGHTIRATQDRKTDRKKFCDKWETELRQDICIDRPLSNDDRSLPQRVAKLYADQGIRGVTNIIARRLS